MKKPEGYEVVIKGICKKGDYVKNITTDGVEEAKSLIGVKINSGVCGNNIIWRKYEIFNKNEFDYIINFMAFSI